METLSNMLSLDATAHHMMLAGRMIAAVAGAAILGFEREWKGKAAGLRTHIVVSLGAATFSMVSLEMAASLDGDRIDPTRALQGVVGGIGFLGAGQIIHARGDVHGITTAAGIWLTGGVGVACGTGEFFIAALAVTIGFLTFTLIGWFERRLLSQPSSRDPARSTGNDGV